MFDCVEGGWCVMICVGDVICMLDVVLVVGVDGIELFVCEWLGIVVECYDYD